MAMGKVCSLRGVAVAAVLAGLARGLGPGQYQHGRPGQYQAWDPEAWDLEVEEPDDLCSLAHDKNSKVCDVS